MKTILSHIIFCLLLCQLISSCGSSSTLSSEEPITIAVVDSTNSKENNAEYIDIEPVLKSDSIWEYEYLAMRLRLKPESKIEVIQATDFQVLGMIFPSDQRINIYMGMHPETPNALWFCNKSKGPFEIRDTLILKASNNNQYSFKENVPTTAYLNDTTPVITYDSLYIEIYITDSNYIWVSKPLDKKKGRIDILVESKNPDKDWKYHFFGNSESLEQSEKVINLAKQISL